MQLPEIRIYKIDTLSFNISNFDFEVKEVKARLNVKAWSALDKENELVFVRLEINLDVSTEEDFFVTVANIETEHAFFSLGWKDFINEQDSNFAISAEIDNFLVNISYNDTRGILAAKASDSFVGKMYLPIIDTSSIIQNDTLKSD